MGNTINPTALRLGWSKGWIDNYYTKELYYPQLMHKILKLRFILNSILNQYWKGKKYSPYLFSHILINKLIKKINISVYFYDTLAQKVWDTFYGRLLPRWSRIHIKMLVAFKKKTNYINYMNWNYNWRTYPKPKKDNIWVRPLRLRVFFILIFCYLKFLNQKFLEYSELNLVNWRLLFYYAYNKNPKVLSENFPDFEKNYIYHLLIIHQFFNKSKHGLTFARERGYLRAARSIISNAFTFTWTLTYMRFTKTLLLRLCKNLFSNDVIDFNFYKVNNDNTNAMFLAKFMARKLLQGHRLFEVLNPIKRELKWRTNRRYKKMINRVHNRKMLKNKKDLFKNLRINSLVVLNHYMKLLSIDFFINKTLLNFDNFLLSYVYNKKKKWRWLEDFFFAKPLLFLTFKCSINSFIVFNFNYLKDKMQFNIKDNFLLINNMFNDIKKSYTYSSVSRFQKITTISSFYNINDLIQLSANSFIKYLQMKYTKYLIEWEYEYFKINKRDLRNKPIRTKFKRLLGFKLQLRGRFSRKQIAANHVFQSGTIGLNTIMNNLDYGFATIPLFNSAVGIKVWLNWNKKIRPISLKIL